MLEMGLGPNHALCHFGNWIKLSFYFLFISFSILSVVPLTCDRQAQFLLSMEPWAAAKKKL